MNIVSIRRRTVAAAVSISIVLCASCVSQSGGQDRIEYVVEDIPAQTKIVVRLTNNTRYNICLGASNWPDDKGRIGEAQIVALEVDEQSFLPRDLGHYDCFDFKNDGSCSYQIRPGETLVGRIPYENFSLPASLRHEPKTLRFQPPYTLKDGGCEPSDL